MIARKPPPSPLRARPTPAVSRFLAAGLRVNFPPQGFDPARASDAELKRFFLPPRPDAVVAPRALALWRRAMAGPPDWPAAAAASALFAQSTLRSHTRLAGPSNAPAEAASANWSGAFARPPEPNARFTRVQAIWTVPQPAPPAPVAGEYASSTWVGLDGRDAASRSLPQIGTGQWVSRDGAGQVTPQVFAWWQWYARGAATNGQVVITGLPVTPGDEIYAQVAAVGPATAAMFIANLTRKAAFPFWFDFVGPVQPTPSPENPLPVRIEGRTAAWVLERPAHADDPFLFELPDYGATEFQACLAGTDAPGGEVDLARARLMRMVDWNPPPAAARLVSVASRLDASRLALRFTG